MKSRVVGVGSKGLLFPQARLRLAWGYYSVRQLRWLVEWCDQSSANAAVLCAPATLALVSPGSAAPRLGLLLSPPATLAR